MASYDHIRNGFFSHDMVLVEQDHNSQIGMMIGNAVFTGSETQVYKKIERVLQENVTLKNILQENSTRLQKHYDDCLRWKNKEKDKKEAMKLELFEQNKTVELLQNKIKSLQEYDFPLDEADAPDINNFYAELNTHYIQLGELMSLDAIQERTVEEAYVVISQAVQDTKSIINEIKKHDCHDLTVFEDLQTRLYNISLSYSTIESEELHSIKDTLKAVQDTVRRYSLIPVVTRPSQKITFSQYVDLKAKLDMTLTENQENTMKIEELRDIENENEKMKKRLLEAEESITQLNKKLTEKNNQIKSMEAKLDDKSFEISINQFVSQNKTYEEENLKLKREIERLSQDLSDTQETFNKVDEENSVLYETVEELKQKLEVFSTGVNASKPDVQEFQQQVPSFGAMESITFIDKKDVRIGELEEKLNELNDKLEFVEAEKRGLLSKSQKIEKENKNNKSSLERCKKRENRDNDKINSLKEKIEEMRLHIEQLQNCINAKTKEDDVIKTLEYQSLQFVNQSDKCDSIGDLSNVSTSDVNTSQNGLNSLDEVHSINCDSTETLPLLKFEKDLKSKEEEIQRMSEEKEEFEKDLKLKEEEIQRMSEEKEEFGKDLKSKEEEIQRMLKEKEEFEKDLKTKEEEIQRMSEEKEKFEKNLRTKEESMQRLLKENNDLTIQLEELSDSREHNNQSMTELQNQWDEHIKQLEDENNVLEGQLLVYEEQTKKLMKQLEEKLDENKKLLETNFILEGNYNQIRADFSAHDQSHDSTQRVLEKYKRDYEALWSSYEQQMREMKDLKVNENKSRSYIHQLTTEVNDLIAQKDLEFQQLLKRLQDHEAKTRTMREELETLPVLKMQMDVYQNDFNAEREAREQLHSDLQQTKDHVNQLTMENRTLKEQLTAFGHQPLKHFQNRHATGDYNPHSASSHNSGSSYGRVQTGRRSQAGGGGGSSGYGNLGLFGRGGENRNETQPERNDDMEARTCPKCEKKCPDLDTLQIHLMECLDREEDEGRN